MELAERETARAQLFGDLLSTEVELGANDRVGAVHVKRVLRDALGCRVIRNEAADDLAPGSDERWRRNMVCLEAVEVIEDLA